MKFLKHKDTKKIRILMRRDKTLKICANHYRKLLDVFFFLILFFQVNSTLKLEPNVGSDRSWVYTTPDFSEEEQTTETFAVKLGNVDSAKEFKAKFEEAQKEMKELNH